MVLHKYLLLCVCWVLPGGYSYCYFSWVVAHRVRVCTEKLGFSVLSWTVTALFAVIVMTQYQHEDFSPLAPTIHTFLLLLRKILVNRCNSSSTIESYRSPSKAHGKTIITVITVLNNPCRGTKGDRTGIATSRVTNTCCWSWRVRHIL